jgi:uncharacterized protein (UPF0261 family)
MNLVFTRRIKEVLNPQIEIQEVDHHINTSAFADIAAKMMDEMVQESQ